MPRRTLPLGSADLPEAPRLRKLIGPSFIILGLGLGSGEVVLWPYMVSLYGLGIVWGMVVGITMQFFINMEVERYALINGESVFVGFARLLRWLPLWFIASTFFGFGWPGIGLYGATLLSEALRIGHPDLVGAVLFLLIGCVLSVGKVLYKTVETLQKYLIGIGVPFIVALAFTLASRADVLALARGLIGRGVFHGQPYLFLPDGILIATFLGALAYAGAGGNLNLTQSCYIRDKGYGMGKYASRITSLFHTGGTQKFALTGSTFPVTAPNVRRFHRWWRAVNVEHALIFWALGAFTMLTLSLLASVTVFGIPGEEGIAFVITEAVMIGQRTLPAVGFLFLIVTGIMLAATQLTVLDSTSRIITENLLLFLRKEDIRVSRVYYVVLWVQILFGIAVFLAGFDQPLTLIVLGAVINAFSMFVYCGIILWLNNTRLAKALRPALWRNGVMLATLLFLGYFCTKTLMDKL